MYEMVRQAAGIHMATFKDKAKDEESVEEDEQTGLTDDVDGSAWTPPPSFLADMRRAEAAAGVNTS